VDRVSVMLVISMKIKVADERRVEKLTCLNAHGIRLSLVPGDGMMNKVDNVGSDGGLEDGWQ